MGKRRRFKKFKKRMGRIDQIDELEELEVENDYYGQCIISSILICNKCYIDCREDRSIVNELLGE